MINKRFNKSMNEVSRKEIYSIPTDGSLHSVEAVMDVLKDFESRSGLAISIQKTCMFAAGFKEHELNLLKEKTNLECGTLPIRYLGVPLCTKKLSIHQCASLLQSIKSKLLNWTVKTLSYAGRLQLLSTVIAGITNFWASTFILPQACISEINSLCSKFLWKGKLEGHNSAKVSWENVTQSKANGGLGLRNLSDWNTACALKLIWMMFFHQDSIWSTWYIYEVLDGNINNFWVINTKKKNSWLANQLIVLRAKVYPWIKMKVGNGETCYFWSSNWSPFGNIREFLTAEGSPRIGIPQSTTLAELWENDSWVMPSARSEAQVKVQSFLSSIQISNFQDYYEWWPNNHKRGKYCTGEIYNLIANHKSEVTWNREVWFSGGIPKHKFLTWLMVLNRSPTRDRLLKWGLQTDSSCLLCNSDLESRSHLYFACNFSWQVWHNFASRCRFQPSRDWNSTLSNLRQFSSSRCGKKLLLLAWQTSIYLLWAERNNRLHRQTSKPVDVLIRQGDLLIRNRIASLRQKNPTEASSMLQQWFSS